VGYARRRLLADDHEAFAQTWRALADHNALGELHRIAAPVTVLGGTHDVASPGDGLREIHRHLPNSRLEFIDGPHMLHLEVPQLFSSCIRRHLAWVERASTGDDIVDIAPRKSDRDSDSTI
jgi:pimeloyl-ACP methyl ester carboxylesterase